MKSKEIKIKKIGIVGWNTGENSFGVTKPYLEFFRQFGQVEILTPDPGVKDNIDLVVLPGGQDVYSLSYREVPSFTNSNPDLHKQFFFDNNLGQYIERKVPIFGICLGIQQINAFFGGTLTQDMRHPYSSPRWELVHKVYPLSPEGIIMKNRSFKVNSLHHQAIHIENDLSKELIPVLVAEDEEFVECLKHKTLPIYGVQYHPEETNCEFVQGIVKELLYGKIV